MRIALVHSFYSRAQPSGENNVVEMQLKALSEAGHVVRLIKKETDSLATSRSYGARTALQVATGYGHDPTQDLSAFRPDVVHVHNLFPNLSSRWMLAQRFPIVSTLHNFRSLCAKGTLFRAGNVCEECITAGPARSLRYGCYRGSRLATLPLYLQNRNGLTGSPFLQGSNLLIALSRQAADVYERAGVRSSRIRVLPNPANLFSEAGSANAKREPHWLYVGRLAEEKGILELLEEWPSSTSLEIVGDGPLRERAEHVAMGKPVRFKGALDKVTVQAQMRRATGLVFPSRGYESAPAQVYLEALCAGLPVLALKGSAVASEVIRLQVGEVVSEWSTTSLQAALGRLSGNAAVMAERCREAYQREYGVRTWLPKLLGIYNEAMDARATPTGNQADTHAS